MWGKNGNSKLLGFMLLLMPAKHQSEDGWKGCQLLLSVVSWHFSHLRKGSFGPFPDLHNTLLGIVAGGWKGHPALFPRKPILLCLQCTSENHIVYCNEPVRWWTLHYWELKHRTTQLITQCSGPFSVLHTALRAVLEIQNNPWRYGIRDNPGLYKTVILDLFLISTRVRERELSWCLRVIIFFWGTLGSKEKIWEGLKMAVRLL